MSLPHLLMGIINMEPITAYDLNKRFEQRPQKIAGQSARVRFIGRSIVWKKRARFGSK